MERATARFAVILILSCAASSAQARAPIDPYCVRLAALIRAANERPSFRSMERAPPSLPDFTGPCAMGYDHGRRLMCWIRGSNARAWDALVARTARCLPNASRERAAQGIRRATFRLGNVYVNITEHHIWPNGIDQSLWISRRP